MSRRCKSPTQTMPAARHVWSQRSWSQRRRTLHRSSRSRRASRSGRVRATSRRGRGPIRIPTRGTATVDYGGGSGPQPLSLVVAKTFVLNHVYPNSGTYVATVRVTDSHNASGTARLNVTVNNVAPTASIDQTPQGHPQERGRDDPRPRVCAPRSRDALQLSWTICARARARRSTGPPRCRHRFRAVDPFLHPDQGTLSRHVDRDGQSTRRGRRDSNHPPLRPSTPVRSRTMA